MSGAKAIPVVRETRGETVTLAYGKLQENIYDPTKKAQLMHLKYFSPLGETFSDICV